MFSMRHASTPGLTPAPSKSSAVDIVFGGAGSGRAREERVSFIFSANRIVDEKERRAYFSRRTSGHRTL
jgi:hypothetical protein